MLRRRSAATGIGAKIVTRYFGSLNLSRTIRNGTTHRDCRADGQRGIDAITRHHDWRRGAIRLDEAKRIRMQGREVEGAAGSARPLMGAVGAADGASARLPVHAGFVFIMQGSPPGNTAWRALNAARTTPRRAGAFRSTLSDTVAAERTSGAA